MGADQLPRARRRWTCPAPARRPRRTAPPHRGRRVGGRPARAAPPSPPGHLAGTLGFELSTNFVTYLGWLYRWGAPLTLIGETPRTGRRRPPGAGPYRHRRPRRRRRRRDPTTLAAGRRPPLLPRSPTSPTWPSRHGRRRPCSTSGETAEYDESARRRARCTSRCTSSPTGSTRFPDGEIWVHCASGYRASVAASILIDRPQRDVVLVNDDYENAEKQGLTT